MIRALALVACFGTLAAILEREADGVLVTAQIEKEARDRKALRPDQLSLPLGCEATLTTSVSGITLTRDCYNRKEVYTAHEHP